jgi:hypothetical protein
MLVVLMLLVRPHMPGSSKGMTQTKRGSDLGHEANKLSSIKKTSLMRSPIMDAGWIILVIREIKFKRWQQKAVDREELVLVIKEAKALGRLHSQGGKEGRSVCASELASELSN